MARTRSRTRARLAPPEGSVPLTFHGETAYYTPGEQAALRPLADNPTPENENAMRFIHAAKVHLDATLVE